MWNRKRIHPQEKEIAQLIADWAFILDVLTMIEVEKVVAMDATNIPLLGLKRRLDELPRDKVIVTYCGTGEHAGKAINTLEAAGFNVVNGGGHKTILKLVASSA